MMEDLELNPPTGSAPHERPPRTRHKPSLLSEEQERDAQESRRTKKTDATKKASNKVPETNTNLHESNTLLRLILDKLDHQDATIQRLQEQLDKKEQDHQEETSKLCQQIKELNETIESMQIQELKETVKAIYETTSALPPSIPSSQTPSMGRSWASVVTSSSLLSPATKATRTQMRLPSISVNLQDATTETRDLLTDPIRAKEILSKELGQHELTKQVQIEGIKSSPGNIIKIFVKNEEDVRLMREHRAWLHTLNGAIVKGNPWYPIKVDNIRRTDTLQENGKIRPDFKDMFLEENNAQVTKMYWLSGAKPYGSMIVYLAKESDAARLLHRKIVQIRGEAAFTSQYQHRERPLRCRNCQQYNHKEARCHNPTVCEKCAGPHKTPTCKAETYHCGACGGDHQASDPICSRWEEEKSKIRSQKRDYINNEGPKTTVPDLTDVRVLT
jgi:hypothetical protein